MTDFTDDGKFAQHNVYFWRVRALLCFVALMINHPAESGYKRKAAYLITKNRTFWIRCLLIISISWKTRCISVFLRNTRMFGVRRKKKCFTSNFLPFRIFQLTPQESCYGLTPHHTVASTRRRVFADTSSWSMCWFAVFLSVVCSKSLCHGVHMALSSG